MKTINKNLKFFFVAFIILTIGIGNSFARKSTLTTDNSPVLTQEEIQGLLKMREEEKMAHEVYSFMYEKWDFIVFKNIAESELRHTNSIKYILAFYNIDDPYKEGVGNYTNPEFTKLYRDLVNESSKSFEKALETGAKIEDLDIADLNELMSTTKNTRILQMYENLVRGSRNHIRTLVNQLQMRGIQYTPKFLIQNKYDAIISSNMEKRNFRNNNNCTINNQGMKRGQYKHQTNMKGMSNSRRNNGNCNGRGMGRRTGINR